MRLGFLEVFRDLVFKPMNVGVLLFSCIRIPEEVVEFDDPPRTININGCGVKGRDTAVYYDTFNHDRRFWKYSHVQPSYRVLDFYGMNIPAM